MTEADFIALVRGAATDPAARALADDAAVFGDLVLTHDMMVEGVHWPAAADPADVAWKLVGANLSDLAAKGAAPLGVLLGFTLGADDWDRRFAEGLTAALAHHDSALWGGDTVAAARPGQARTIGLTAIGRATFTPAPSRRGAQPGDGVWVTGTIGDALLGFLHPEMPGPSLRFRRPTPRLDEGRALAPMVSAMMDVSDGLLLDAQRMALASGVTIAIDSALVPRSPALQAAIAEDSSLADRALRWGDDYELLCTLPAATTPPAGVTRIGIVQPAGAAPLLLDGDAPDALQPLGYLHHGE